MEKTPYRLFKSFTNRHKKIQREFWLLLNKLNCEAGYNFLTVRVVNTRHVMKSQNIWSLSDTNWHFSTLAHMITWECLGLKACAWTVTAEQLMHGNSSAKVNLFLDQYIL